jgi:hypothetical protein
VTFYTRHQIVELLEVEEGFILRLEQEEIIHPDAPPDAPSKFSEQMLERVRVAHNLVRDLDVNFAGAAIIVRLREEMASMRHQLERLVVELRQQRKESG